jgi:glycosyltransferase involved in cell wall biosynthesis
LGDTAVTREGTASANSASDACAGTSPRYCIVIPTYDNPRTIAGVVEKARAVLPDIIVVNDGSAAEGRAACVAIAGAGAARVVHRDRNGGKGAAVKAGFALARQLGFSHVLQVDADGQHDLGSAARFLEASRCQPDALINAYPLYDDTAPAVRRIARKFTQFWVDLEVGRGVIKDAMIGFRIYPLEAVERIGPTGDRMDFDIEVAVRLAWSGVAVVNLPVQVRYFSAAEGGVSHFRPLWDSLHFSWLHSKLCTVRCMRAVLGGASVPRLTS